MGGCGARGLKRLHLCYKYASPPFYWFVKITTITDLANAKIITNLNTAADKYRLYGWMDGWIDGLYYGSIKSNKQLYISTLM